MNQNNSAVKKNSIKCSHKSASPFAQERQSSSDQMGGTFYSTQLVAVAFWWFLIRLATGKPLYSLCNGSVITRPSWLPKRVLIGIAAHKIKIFVAMPALLVVGARVSDALAVRLAVAAWISLYHLIETSYTSRHGEYPVLWTSWGCVLPPPFDQAAAWGVAIHFVLSCGIAKCLVGGVSAWTGPTTMATYLDAYHSSTTSKPASRRLNRLLARPSVASAVGTATLLLECVVIPATLVLPAWLRPVVGTGGMVALHVGIGLGLSSRVALVFLTTLPSYIYGFGCPAPHGSAAWWLAASVGLLPSLVALCRRRLLPEDWPSTPCSLFMWGGAQAERMSRNMMTGRLRIVLATREVGERPGGVAGLPVLHHGGSGAFGMGSSHEGDAVHDGVLRAMGYTLVHGGLVRAFDLPGSGGEEAMLRALLRALEQWMARERRLLETASGRPLARAFHVRIDADGRVEKVLLEANCHLRG